MTATIPTKRKVKPVKVEQSGVALVFRPGPKFPVLFSPPLVRAAQLTG